MYIILEDINEVCYIVEKNLLVKNSLFFKDLFSHYELEEIKVPYDLSSFIYYISLHKYIYEDVATIKKELLLHLYLECEEYFILLVNQLLSLEDRNTIIDLYTNLPDDLRWLIQYHLPLTYLSGEALTDTFIMKYRELRQKYPIKTSKITVVAEHEELFCYDEKRLIQGPYICFWPKGTIQEKGFRINGYKEGVWKTMYENGTLETVCFWKNNIKNGLEKRWSLYDNNDLSKGTYLGQVRTWSNGIIVGVEERWGSSKNITSRYTYLDNGFVRQIEVWYDNGMPLKKINIIDGKLHGSFEVWFQSGSILERSNWINGDRDGLTEYWYENGSPQYKCMYIRGKQNGLHETWYDNGQQKNIGHWQNDEKHGTFQTWYDNGQQESIGYWQNGEKHGIFEMWYEDNRQESMERSEWVHGKQKD